MQMIVPSLKTNFKNLHLNSIKFSLLNILIKSSFKNSSFNQYFDQLFIQRMIESKNLAIAI